MNFNSICYRLVIKSKVLSLVFNFSLTSVPRRVLTDEQSVALRPSVTPRIHSNETVGGTYLGSPMPTTGALRPAAKARNGDQYLPTLFFCFGRFKFHTVRLCVFEFHSIGFE